MGKRKKRHHRWWGLYCSRCQLGRRWTPGPRGGAVCVYSNDGATWTQEAPECAEGSAWLCAPKWMEGG